MRVDKEITHKRSINNAKTLEERFIGIHGHKYSYADSVYIGAMKSISIKCYEHGTFTQVVNDHLHGSGCPKCGRLKLSNSKQAHTDKELLAIALKFKTQVDLKASNMKAFSAIKDRGVKFSTKCFKHMTGIFWTSARFQKMIGHNWDILTPFNNLSTTITVKCKQCYKERAASPKKLLEGYHKCTACNPHTYGSFDMKKPSILYYISVTIGNTTAFKIGVTNRTINERFEFKDRQNIKVLDITKFNKGMDCYALEQQILNKYRKYKYKGVDLLSSGNTELFNIDIRKLKENYNGIKTLIQD